MADQQPNNGHHQARPDYELYEARRLPSLFVCSDCGSVVHNMKIHDAWHRGIAGRRSQATDGELADSPPRSARRA